ncbi:MAG TPA: hypothetical protein PK043_15555, partial [Alicycliphilus sp.]|nr:hypothetical protein [Alicycliphilus sp.]
HSAARSGGSGRRIGRRWGQVTGVLLVNAPATTPAVLLRPTAAAGLYPQGALRARTVPRQ